jgi:hypothetical protein
VRVTAALRYNFGSECFRLHGGEMRRWYPIGHRVSGDLCVSSVCLSACLSVLLCDNDFL